MGISESAGTKPFMPKPPVYGTLLCRQPRKKENGEGRTGLPHFRGESMKLAGRS